MLAWSLQTVGILLQQDFLEPGPIASVGKLWESYYSTMAGWSASNKGGSSRWSSSESRDWSCKCCNATNWPKHKACWVCGARRSYAEVTSSNKAQLHTSAPAPAPSKALSLNDQLAEMMKVLGGAMPSGQGRPIEQPSGMEVDQQSGDRHDFVQQLHKVEAALANLPDEAAYKSVREPLMHQAEELKRKITGSRPLGARIDGCRGALERARKRHDAASQGVAMATKILESASTEVTRLEAELKELEASVAAHQQMEQKNTCLDRLQADMKQVVQEMVNSHSVRQEDVADSMKHMETLFQGLVSISQQSKLAGHAPAPPSVLEMLCGHTNNSTTIPVPGAPELDARVAQASAMQPGFCEASGAQGGA